MNATALELFDDSDTCEVDGITYRLRIEPDIDADINDYDCYGRVDSGGRGNDYHHETRPDGMDGNAERISYIAGMIWWQPPADVKRTDPGFSALRSLVSDLASFGFKIVVLERLGGTDAYGRRIVEAVTSLGGIDSLENGYLAEIVADLFDELSAS